MSTNVILIHILNKFRIVIKLISVVSKTNMVENSSNSLDILKNFSPGDLSPLYSQASLKLHIDVILAGYIAEVDKIAQVSLNLNLRNDIQIFDAIFSLFNSFRKTKILLRMDLWKLTKKQLDSMKSQRRDVQLAVHSIDCSCLHILKRQTQLRRKNQLAR